MRVRYIQATLVGLALALLHREAGAEEVAAKTPEPSLSAAWIITQAVPSPELAFGNEGTRFGLRWQVTPALYSFGVHRRVSPWRFFVVDPIARQSGSLEWHVSPELWTSGTLDGAFRSGVRAYFPIHHRGEYLSCSLGTSAFLFRDEVHASYDLGIYAFSGVIGLETALSPSSDALRGIVTLKLRYF